MSSIIRRLDETVVNRIAAGEVIQRPANAIKEMIENCIDAKATSITVTVKDGGLKLIQIQDNGSGIQKDDMMIVCERFTTSKLSKFEDLNSISTYGFRGEALASISHVAHVSIVSKTKQSACAYKGQYIDGKLKTPVCPCAGNQGTIITAEDLFYNITTRRRTLKSPSEEHSRITDVINRYAVHNSNIGFCLKKSGISMSDIKTPVNSNTVDNIRLIYGNNIAKELMSVEGSDLRIGLKVNGFITNANYSTKKLIFLLFINHRLVECSQLNKAIDTVYSNYLPKGMSPFIYLSLEIEPSNIDVNVHPTKYEVQFLHEQAVIEKIQQIIEQKLLTGNSSRTFYTQALIAVPKTGTQSADNENAEKKTQAYNMVRTDPKNQTLDSFIQAEPRTESTSVDIQETVNTGGTPTTSDHSFINQSRTKRTHSDRSIDDKPESRRNVNLASVINLRKQVRDNGNTRLREMVKDHTFVGCVDRDFTLIQHQTKLYLLNNKNLTHDLFYQLVLHDFSNLGLLRLSEPAPISELVLLALDLPDSGWCEADGPKVELAKYACQFLISKSDMLSDYFSIDIDKSGNLIGIPMVLEGYIPDLNRLPLFMIRLATEVSWDREEACLKTISEEIARFYSLQKRLIKEQIESDDWRKVVEFTVFSAMRSTLLPSNERAEDTTFLQIADLPNLYKVFERC